MTEQVTRLNAFDLLSKAAEQFRFYEKQHRAKNTEEATAKAEVNAALALEIETALQAPATVNMKMILTAMNDALISQQFRLAQHERREAELMEAGNRYLNRARTVETAVLRDSAIALAQMCHEANKAYCESIGDFSQKSWLDADEGIRESALNGVYFHVNNPEAGDSASHDNWMKMKLERGWVYGPEKNETLKTHHCLVPFDQLPPEQQFKDKLFRTLVHTAVHGA